MRKYAKNLKEYEKVEFDSEAILDGMIRFYGEQKRKSTSIALEEELIEDLKAIAKAKKIPYQVLMRIILKSAAKEIKKKVA